MNHHNGLGIHRAGIEITQMDAITAIKAFR
jgi:hypothetical protein